MASINFVPGTVIPSTWLNDVNNAVYVQLPPLVSDVASLVATAVRTTGSNMTGSINNARTTVAATSTTTPLWTITNGAVQDWTGTPTILDFPAAAQAGASRVVYPAVGTVINNAGNIAVQGNTNFTVALGDELTITAVTTTTFYVTIKRKNGLAVTTASAALTDQDRRNAYLNWMYQSKAFVGYRRGVNLFADGYKASDGINSGASSGYVLDTTGGKVGTSAGGTTTISPFNAPGGFGGVFTMFDRSSAVPNNTVINAIGIYSASAGTFAVKVGLRNSAGNFTIAVSQSVSHPGGGFVDFTLSSPYTVPASGTYYLGAANNTLTGTASATASVLRSFLAGDITSGTSGGYTENSDIVFPLRYVVVTTNITVVTTSQTVTSSVSSGRLQLEYDPIGSPVLNTDLTAEITCNGGTNWTAATLSVAGTGQAGRTVLETPVVTCTAGTSFAARIKTLNNKNTQIYGTAVEVYN